MNDFVEKHGVPLLLATLGAGLLYFVHELYHPTIGPFFDSLFVEFLVGSIALGALAVAGDYLHSLAMGHDFRTDVAAIVFLVTAGIHQLFHDVLSTPFVGLSLSGIMAVTGFVGVLVLHYVVR